MSMTPEETFFDRMERERQAQQAELEKTRLTTTAQVTTAKLEARKDTKEMIAVVVGILAALALLGTLCVTWFTDIGDDPAQHPKYSDSEVEQQRENRCVDTGGGWLPKDTFGGSYPEHGMCVYPGRKVGEVQ